MIFDTTGLSIVLAGGVVDVAKEKYDLVVIGLNPNSSFGERSNSLLVFCGGGLAVDGNVDNANVVFLTSFSRNEKEVDNAIGVLDVVEVNRTLGPSPLGRMVTTAGVTEGLKLFIFSFLNFFRRLLSS